MNGKNRTQQTDPIRDASRRALAKPRRCFNPMDGLNANISLGSDYDTLGDILRPADKTEIDPFFKLSAGNLITMLFLADRWDL